jgi:predicted HTH domain antitoxin
MESGERVWRYEVLVVPLYRMRQQKHSTLAAPVLRGSVANGNWAVSVPLPGVQLPVLAECLGLREGVVRKVPALSGIRANHLAGQARQNAATNSGKAGSASLPLCYLPQEFCQLSASTGWSCSFDGRISSRVMTLTLSDDILKAVHLSESELKAELAVTLFQQNRLTLSQAARLAQMPQLDFQRLLANREISIHYGVDQLEYDLKRVAELPLP